MIIQVGNMKSVTWNGSIILSLFLICSTYAQENDLRFDRILIEDGLTSINAILKDKSGYMWFGGSNGLYRFDGYKYKLFSNDPNNTESLSSNYVTCLYEDDAGILWVGTINGGLNRFDPVLEKFTHYIHDEGDKSSISDNNVTSIVQTKNGILWVTTMKGINCINKQNNSFKRYYHTYNSISNDEVFSMIERNDGKFWLTSNAGVLDLFNPEDGTCQHYSYHAGNYNSGRTGQRVMQDSELNLWISTEGDGIYMFNTLNNQFTHFQHERNKSGLSSNIVTDIKEGNAGELWISTDGGGLNKLNIASRQFTHYTYNPYDLFSISNNSSYALYVDDQHGVWLGMGDGIVNVLRKHVFELYSPSVITKNSLSFRVVVSLWRSGKNLWIGTGGGGLDKFDLESKTFTNYSYDPLRKESLSTNIVLTIAEDKLGNIWAGTFLGGLNKLNPENNRIQVFRHSEVNDNTISSDHVFDIAIGKNSEIWIATHGGGLDCFHQDTKTIEHYRNKPGDKNSLNSDRVISLLFDKKNQLWVGTLDGGLQIFNSSSRTFQEVKFDTLKNGVARSYVIHHLMEDNHGNVWISTGGNGVYKYNPFLKSTVHFNAALGMPTNSIYGTIEDNSGNIWMSTNKGIVELDVETGKLYLYTTADGLPTNDFEAGAIVKDERGRLYFASKQGVVAFFPNQIQRNNEQVKVRLTELRIFNKVISPGQEIDGEIPLIRALPFSEEVVLSHAFTNFSIEFAAPGHAVQEKIRYMYRLDGAQNRWIETDSKMRSAYFSNLDAGRYFFEVKAMNSDGNWSPIITRLKIIIEPPIWKTFTAYILYFILLVAISVFIVKEIHKRILIRNQLEIEKYKHEIDINIYTGKIDFFTNISHELRTPLTLIVGTLERLVGSNHLNERDMQSLRVVQRNGQLLLSLVNQLLDFRKFESGTMKLAVARNDISVMVKNSRHSFNDLAMRQQLNFKYQLEMENTIAWFDKQKVEMIINNLLSNAFKFTPPYGSVSIVISRNNGHLIIDVTDTGEGISENERNKIFEPFYQSGETKYRSKAGTGIGLSLTKSLVELHKGTIEVHSESGKGARFLVSIPVSMQYYEESELIENTEVLPAIESDSDTLNFMDKEKDEYPEKVPAPLLLIVEDNFDLREFIKSGFIDYYSIQEADNGLTALQYAYELIPDIIISDIMMPEMDGIEFCTRIKQDERTSHIPVILLTARASVTNQYEGLEVGADDYITKPFSFDLLKLRVNNLLTTRRRLRDRFLKELLISTTEMDIVQENTSIGIADELFLKNVIRIIEDHLSEVEFTVGHLAKELGMSHSVLYRKILALTDKTVIDFVRFIRLQKARTLLSEKGYTINVVSEMVGFSDAKYFSTRFKAEFGVTPSEFVEKDRKPKSFPDKN